MRQRLALSLLLCGAALVAHGAYLPAKAQLAQALLQRAWQKTISEGGAQRPWPWADTYPVARLRAPSQEVDLIVLAGATGSSLAFGPGHVTGSGAPGSGDMVVLGGHRDTHFRFLERLGRGDVLELAARGGQPRRYVVDRTQVVDTRHWRLLPQAGSATLALVTCYPFDALRPGGTQRFVVSAREVSL